MTGSEGDRHLDARGLNCPLPILRTKRELLRLSPGEVLRVEATDPHAVIDFLAFADKTPHAVLEHWEDGGVYVFLVRKGDDTA